MNCGLQVSRVAMQYNPGYFHPTLAGCNVADPILEQGRAWSLSMFISPVSIISAADSDPSADSDGGEYGHQALAP